MYTFLAPNVVDFWTPLKASSAVAGGLACGEKGSVLGVQIINEIING